MAAEPEEVHERNKRMILHDKQKEFPIRTYRDKSVYQYYGNDRLTSRAHLGGSDASMDFNDPYYDHQWYLVSLLYKVVLVSASIDSQTSLTHSSNGQGNDFELR